MRPREAGETTVGCRGELEIADYRPDCMEQVLPALSERSWRLKQSQGANGILPSLPILPVFDTSSEISSNGTHLA